MDHTPAVILDFDGTLVDSFPLALEIFYQLTKTQPIENEDLSRLRGMTFRQAAKELRIPLRRVPVLLMRGRQTMFRQLGQVRVFEGMENAIPELAKDYKLFVLSSNSKANIISVLERYKLDGFFVEIYGSISLLSKARKIRQIIKKNKLDRSRTWYVGDEARDIEAAHHAGVHPIAVSWGYNNIHVLKQHHPEALVFTTEELIRCITDN